MDSSRLPVEAIQPKIRAQLAEAMTRQYQMTALQHQTGSKPGEKPISSPILQIRGAFSVPSPGPSGRRSAVPESKLAASPKQSRKYEPEPPRDKALGPESLGYADFYPQKPMQDEDLLTEAHIRQGYVDKPLLANESLSAQDMVGDWLNDLGSLGRMMNVGTILLAKREGAPILARPGRRSPKLETLDNTAIDTWFRNLANPGISLDSLAVNVPNDVDDDILLEKFSSLAVPVLRASWCSRALIAAEIPLSILMDNGEPRWVSWADAIKRFLAKQLDALPGDVDLVNSVSGQAHQGAGPKTDGTEKTGTQKLLDNWNYGIRLLMWQCEEKLLPLSTFLKWAVQRFRKANEVQTYLLAHLLLDWVVALSSSRGLSRDVVEAALQRLEWLSRGSKDGKAPKDAGKLAVLRLVQTIILLDPGVLVAPRWRLTCENVVAEIFAEPAFDFLPEPLQQNCATLLRAYDKDTSRRNLDLSTKNEVPATMVEKKLAFLDLPWHAMSPKDRYQAIFTGEKSASLDQTSFEVTARWATTCQRAGNYRFYLVAELFRQHLVAGANAEGIQTFLMDLLDSHLPANDAEERNVLSLFAELQRCRVFSYGLYLQRHIARGSFSKNLARDEEPGDLRYLRILPLVRPAPFLRNQRSSLIDSTWSIRHEHVYDAIRQAIMSTLCADSVDDVPEGLSALDRFNQVRLGEFVFDWALANLDKMVADVDRICIAMRILEDLFDFSHLRDLCVVLLSTAQTRRSIQAIVDCLERHLDVFYVTAAFDEVSQALVSKHSGLIGQAESRRIVASLLQRIGRLPGQQVNLVAGTDEEVPHTIRPTISSRDPRDPDLSAIMEEYRTRLSSGASTSQLLRRTPRSDLDLASVKYLLETVLSDLMSTDGVGIADKVEVLVDMTGGSAVLSQAMLELLRDRFPPSTPSSTGPGPADASISELACLAVQLIALGSLSLPDVVEKLCLPLLLGMLEPSPTTKVLGPQLEFVASVLWQSSHLRPSVRCALENRRSELLEIAPSSYLNLLGAVTCLSAERADKSDINCQSFVEGRHALLRHGIAAHALERGLFRLHDLIGWASDKPFRPSEAALTALRDNAMFLSDFEPHEWAGNVFHLLETMDEWSHPRVMRLLSCRIAAQHDIEVSGLAQAFLSGSVLRGQVSNRMVYRFLEGLERHVLEAVTGLATAMLAQVDLEGCPLFPSSKDGTDTAMTGFLACLFKGAELLATPQSDRPAPNHFAERLCLIVFDHLQWFVQHEKHLAKVIAAATTLSAESDAGLKQTNNAFMETSVQNQAASDLRVKLDARLECLYHLFEDIVKNPVACRLNEYVRVLLILLGLPTFTMTLTETRWNRTWDIVCYWVDTVSEPHRQGLVDYLINLIKGGTLPGKSLVLAERLANQDLGNDVDKSSLSLWEPTEHVTWPMQTSPQRQSYQSVFLQGWQTPILVQLPVENVEDDPFLPVNESGFDSPLDLMIEQGPAHKRQRLQI